MFTNQHIRRVAVSVAAVPALIGGASCSNEDSTETVTSVLEAGDTADAVRLPPTATVGQTAAGTTDFTMNISIGANGDDVNVDVTMSIDMTTEVVEVSEDGGHVRRSTVERLEVESSESSVASEIESSIPQGLSYDETYDADGQLVSTEVVESENLSESVLAAADEFVSQAETGSLYPPGAVVGLGARWTATTTLNSSGAVIDMVVDNELTSLTDSEYGVDMSIDSDIDTSIEGERLTGTVRGGGALTGSRDNPLVSAGNMTIDMEMSGAGVTFTMTMAAEYEFAEADR